MSKHSSISLATETSLSQDEELSFFKHNILRQQTSLRNKANLDRPSNTFVVFYSTGLNYKTTLLYSYFRLISFSVKKIFLGNLFSKI